MWHLTEMAELWVTESLGRPAPGWQSAPGMVGQLIIRAMRSKGLAPAALFFRVLSQCSLERHGLVGLPLTAAGGRAGCFPRRGAAPHGQGLSGQGCSFLQSRVKQLREAWTFLHPSTPLVLALLVLVLQKGGNCWLLTRIFNSMMYFSFQIYIFHKS